MKDLKRTATVALSLLATAAFAAEEPTAADIVRKARAAYAALSSYSDSGTVVKVSSGQTISLEIDTRLQRPNLYRVNWTQKKGLMPGGAANNGMAWSDGNGDFYQTTCSWAGNGPIAKRISQTDEVIDQAAKKTLEMQSKPVTPEAIAALRPQMREMMKQMQPMLKSAFKEGVLYTQTHENISINKSYAPTDFLPSKD